MMLLSSVLLNLILVAVVSSQCDTDDLLSCDFPEVVSASVLCCNDSCLCVEYTGTSVGSSATYTTSEGLCITTELVRTCSQNNTWDGQTPTTKEASEEEELSNWSPTLLWLGVSFFFTGIALAIGGGISVHLRVKKYGAVVKKWYWGLRAFFIFFTVAAVPLWLALLGYTVSNDFSEDDGDLRGSDSSCQSPSGKTNVRDGILIAVFVLSNLVNLTGNLLLGLGYCGLQYFESDGTPIPTRCCCCGKNKCRQGCGPPSVGNKIPLKEEI